MRLAVYVIAGWFLLSLLSSTVFALGSLGIAGLLGPVVVLAAILWLVRGYRSAPPALGPRDAFAGRLAALEGELEALARALPADPLDNEQIVAAWDLHDEHDAAKLSATYAAVREQLGAARRDCWAARTSADSELLARAEAAAEEVREYVRAFRLLATEAPSLLDRALSAHADAQRAVESRRAETDDATDLQALLEADAKLQRARDALAKGRERPLDALELAAAARRIVDAT